ncbi:hypothetical protein FKG94_28430, partial [Exilibacterium tricleocarpae]
MAKVDQQGNLHRKQALYLDRLDSIAKYSGGIAANKYAPKEFAERARNLQQLANAQRDGLLAELQSRINRGQEIPPALANRLDRASEHLLGRADRMHDTWNQIQVTPGFGKGKKPMRFVQAVLGKSLNRVNTLESILGQFAEKEFRASVDQARQMGDRSMEAHLREVQHAHHVATQTSRDDGYSKAIRGSGDILRKRAMQHLDRVNSHTHSGSYTGELPEALQAKGSSLVDEVQILQQNPPKLFNSTEFENRVRHIRYKGTPIEEMHYTLDAMKYLEKHTRNMAENPSVSDDVRQMVQGLQKRVKSFSQDADSPLQKFQYRIFTEGGEVTSRYPDFFEEKNGLGNEVEKILSSASRKNIWTRFDAGNLEKDIDKARSNNDSAKENRLYGNALRNVELYVDRVAADGFAPDDVLTSVHSLRDSLPEHRNALDRYLSLPPDAPPEQRNSARNDIYNRTVGLLKDAESQQKRWEPLNPNHYYKRMGEANAHRSRSSPLFLDNHYQPPAEVAATTLRAVMRQASSNLAGGYKALDSASIRQEAFHALHESTRDFTDLVDAWTARDDLHMKARALLQDAAYLGRISRNDGEPLFNVGQFREKTQNAIAKGSAGYISGKPASDLTKAQLDAIRDIASYARLATNAPDTPQPVVRQAQDLLNGIEHNDRGDRMTGRLLPLEDYINTLLRRSKQRVGRSVDVAKTESDKIAMLGENANALKDLYPYALTQQRRYQDALGLEEAVSGRGETGLQDAKRRYPHAVNLHSQYESAVLSDNQGGIPTFETPVIYSTGLPPYAEAQAPGYNTLYSVPPPSYAQVESSNQAGGSSLTEAPAESSHQPGPSDTHNVGTAPQVEEGRAFRGHSVQPESHSTPGSPAESWASAQQYLDQFPGESNSESPVAPGRVPQGDSADAGVDGVGNNNPLIMRVEIDPEITSRGVQQGVSDLNARKSGEKKPGQSGTDPVLPVPPPAYPEALAVPPAYT